ncbi:MAG TPA: DUF4190 domain-containing protein [Acidimicrobiales bacterium]|nr:DUF4190 domain-containing protein [Acidimicrobiales bacterium]
MTTTGRWCPNGHPIDASASFCTQCGVPSTQSASAPRTCANGHGLSSIDAFCPQCGAPSPFPAPAFATSYVPPPPPGFASPVPDGVGTHRAPPYAPQYAPPYLYARPLGTNGLAIASLVVSLCVFCWGVNAIVALVLGIVALNQIKRTSQDGRGLAIAGIAISVVQLALGVVWLILVIVLAHAGSSSSDLPAHPIPWAPT